MLTQLDTATLSSDRNRLALAVTLSLLLHAALASLVLLVPRRAVWPPMKQPVATVVTDFTASLAQHLPVPHPPLPPVAVASAPLAPPQANVARWVRRPAATKLSVTAAGAGTVEAPSGAGDVATTAIAGEPEAGSGPVTPPRDVSPPAAPAAPTAPAGCAGGRAYALSLVPLLRQSLGSWTGPSPPCSRASVVLVTIDASGRLRGTARLATGCGSHQADLAALAALEFAIRAVPLPPPPPSCRHGLLIEVPVRFTEDE